MTGSAPPPKPVVALNLSVSESTKNAIEKAMRLERAWRWRSAAEFKNALLVTPHPNPSPQVGRGAGVRRWGWIAAVGALVLVVCVLSIVLLSGLWDGSEATTTPSEPGVALAATTIVPTPPASTRPADTAAPARTEPPPTVAPPTESPTEAPAASGADMVLIPAGEFLMGSTDADKDAVGNEKPQHKVYLDAYYIDLTEATNAMYRACVEAGACSKPSCSYYDDSGRARHPVVCVDWNQAVAYCEWRGARLPSEAEWEKAARSEDGRLYPWGDSKPDCSLANYSGCKGDTAEVGSYPSGASPYGLLDMAGNVWEWVQDWYLETFYKDSPFENPLGPSSDGSRVVRGGSWGYGSGDVRVADRYGDTPSNRYDYRSFRCARSP